MSPDSGFKVNKRSAGVFLTQGDPFGYAVFASWLTDAVASKKSMSICEPYAGENGLLASLNTDYHELLAPIDISWSSYDIAPPDNNLFPDSPVEKRNTLLSLPDRYDLIVTNPPYLARNSARRRHLDFPFDYEGTGIAKPQDLYQIALDTCLASADWVCFLIPESFITSSYDKTRLVSVISLPGNLFDDTDCPVCLALFAPTPQQDFRIIAANGTDMGTYADLKKRSASVIGDKPVREFSFNIPDGVLGLRGVDNTKTASIKFVPGEEIPSDKIKESSRSLTRITHPDFADTDISKLIIAANEILDEWRKETEDVFLTAFKGVRSDGRYRRRMSYDIAAMILSKAMENIKESSLCPSQKSSIPQAGS